MKKFIAIMLALFCLAGCTQNKADENSILGSWEAESKMSIIGISMPIEAENQTIDMIYHFEFLENETGKSKIIVDEKYADYIQNVEDNFTYTLDKDKLELTYENGNTQVFTVSFSDGNLILDGRVHLEFVRKKSN